MKNEELFKGSDLKKDLVKATYVDEISALKKDIDKLEKSPIDQSLEDHLGLGV